MSRDVRDGDGARYTYAAGAVKHQLICTGASGAAQASQIVRFIGQMSTGGVSKAIQKSQTLPRRWAHSSLPLSHPLSQLTR